MPGIGEISSRQRVKLEISKAFKLSGYQLRVEASRHLEELLTPVPNPQKRRHWIDKIIETLARKDLDSAVLDRATLNKVIKVLYFFYKLIFFESFAQNCLSCLFSRVFFYVFHSIKIIFYIKSNLIFC